MIFLVFLVLFIKISYAIDNDPCPFFFIIENIKDESHPQDNRVQVDYGTYITLLGKQMNTTFYVNKNEVDKIKSLHPCALIANIVTDEPDILHREIMEWIFYTCKLYQKTKDKCLYPNRYIRRKLEVDDEVEIKEEEVGVNTTSNIVEEQKQPCELIKDRARCSSSQSECYWFGVIYGCQKINYCGFTTREACEQRRPHYCRWRQNTCHVI
jgi:hypothetical protein